MATTRALRRFPLNLNIGTDICHVVRIRKILESTRRSRFIERILNANERQHPKIRSLCGIGPTSEQSPAVSGTDLGPRSTAPCSSSQDLHVAAAFIAGRFAAKEAAIKAHPWLALTWHDITITNQDSESVHSDRAGAPVAIIRGDHEDQEALISISHDGDYATAVCLGAAATPAEA